MRLYGLIGYPLGHSFSQTYFRNKFAAEGITGCDYLNFPLTAITELPALLAAHPQLCGLNITIPYKQQALPYLHHITGAAAQCGAVNCIDIRDGRLAGYNTDVMGFQRSLQPLLQPHHTHALVLGTGGAAQAVEYVLQQLGIQYLRVSRHPAAGAIGYEAIDAALLEQYTLIINTTPVGLWPNIDACPAIPYQHLTNRHLLYDLVYKPEHTLFLQQGAQQGAATKNGYEMLVLQAEASWEIWNNLTI